MSLDQIRKSEMGISFNILNNVGPDSTAEQLEKSIAHKYFKRVGIPGDYKYFYTEADYKAGKSASSPSEAKEASSEPKEETHQSIEERAFKEGNSKERAKEIADKEGGEEKRCPRSVDFVKNKSKYFESMKRDILAVKDKDEATFVARDWLNDIDTQRELGNSLMSHAKSFVNYIYKEKE